MGYGYCTGNTLDTRSTHSTLDAWPWCDGERDVAAFAAVERAGEDRLPCGVGDVAAPATGGELVLGAARLAGQGERAAVETARAHDSPNLLPASVTMTPAELSYSGARAMRTGVRFGGRW